MTTVQRSGNLDALFEPRSVAIVGASTNPGKHGHRLVANLKSGDPSRQVYPITRSGEQILGYQSFATLGELPEPPDLVLVSIPAEAVPDVIDDAVAAGARAAIVFACGFAEAGAAGKALQQRMTDSLAGSALRVVGPNCMGIYDVGTRLKATYYTQLPTEPGKVGFVSQSGAFGAIAFTELTRSGAGLSRFVSLGNMADVTHAELVRHLGEDEATRVIAAFIEGVPDSADLLDAISEASSAKPVVILKGARTKSGQIAAASHTGSLAGDGRVWTALLREAGAIVAEDTDDLFDAASTLARMRGRMPRGNRLGIVTISGGPAVVAADACERYGLRLPALDHELSDIKPLVPEFASLANPVDFTSMIAGENYAPAVAAVAALDSVDTLLAINVGLDKLEFPESFTRVWNGTALPVVGYLVGHRIEQAFTEAGIPNLPSVERAVRAAARLVERAQIVHELEGPLPSPATGADAATPLAAGTLDEFATKRLLAEFGIAVTPEALKRSPDEALAAAAEIGYPVALKLCDPAIVHKSDVGGVILGIRDGSALREAWTGLAQRFPGTPLLVSKMVHGDVELIAGGRRDALFGPVVMLGIGGVYVEVLDDVAFARVPTSPTRARALAGKLRSQVLLDGFRGAEPVDREALANLLERISTLLVAHPEIVELDLNPVLASSDGAVVADATAIVADGPGIGSI